MKPSRQAPLLLLAFVTSLLAGCESPAPGGDPPAATGGAGGSKGSGGSGGSAAGGATSGGAGGVSAAGGTTVAAGGTTSAGGASGTGGTSSDAAAPADTSGAEGGSANPGVGITDGLTQRLVSRGIGMGYYHLCVITPDKSVRCFGDNATRGDRRINPPAGIKPDQVHGAHNGFCYIKPPGGDRVDCWGHNDSSYPGAGVTRDTDPIQVGHGYDFGCVLNRDNSVKCWGQAGARYQPPAGIKAKALTIAAFFTCAIKLDDTVQCWGISPPNPPDPTMKVKLLAAVYHGIDKLGANPGDDNHACAILMDDSVKCWGKEIAGNLTVPAGLKAKDLAVTFDSCAVELDGDVVCWGTGRYPGSSAERWHPFPTGLKAKAIRAGMGTYCALKDDDTLACWGDEQHDHITFPADMKVYTQP